MIEQNKKIMVMLRKWVLPIISMLIAVALFGVIFVRLKLVKLSSSFFIELGMIFSILVVLKILYYSHGENYFEDEKEYIEGKDAYYDKVDKHLTDISDFEIFLNEYNDEIKKEFIKEGIGSKTEDNYGVEKYEKLLFKLRNKADKIKPMTSLQIKTRLSNHRLMSLKNYRKANKYMYYMVTSTVSLITSVLLASIVWDELIMNAESIFRYLTYFINGIWVSYTSFTQGFKITRTSELDHLSRLDFVIDKYINWKDKRRIYNVEQGNG